MASTIFSLATPPGRSAIAIVRLSGPACGPTLAALTPGAPTPEPRTAALRRLVDPAAGSRLDEALVLRFEAPRSETGEDMLELQLHGGRAVVRAVLDTLARMPEVRPAEPGEFARRAFLNGKFDLTAAEGLADLIDAETESQRRLALAHLSGDLARCYDAWRDRLISAMSLIEAGIDFSDEGDVTSRVQTEAIERVEELADDIRVSLAGARRGEIVRDGFRVVIAGAPNVGKSSLLNSIARRDAAIVSTEPGTTRDVIEVRLDLDGLQVVLMDTAGLREAASPVEREGIRRTLERSREADLILHVRAVDQPDATLPTELAEAGAHGRVVSVVNKCDLARANPIDRGLCVSAVTGEGIEELITAITAHAGTAIAGHGDMVPANIRQKAAVTAALGHLDAFLGGDRRRIELRAEDLRLAAHALGTLTGRVDAEQVLDQVFGRFCIGK